MNGSIKKATRKMLSNTHEAYRDRHIMEVEVEFNEAEGLDQAKMMVAYRARIEGRSTELDTFRLLSVTYTAPGHATVVTEESWRIGD